LTWADKDDAPKTISIPILSNDGAEEPETFTVRLGDGRLSGENATITITDSTPTPEPGSSEFSAGDYPVKEGEEAVITVNRTGDTNSALTASVRLAGNATSGTDYDAPAAEQLNLNWAANDKGSRKISIPITADNELNEQEVITLELLDANGGVIGNSQVSISDTTPPTEAGSAEFSAADYPTDEGKTAEITINRTGDTSTALAASVKLGGNAASGTDYDAPAAEQLNLNWAANDKGSRIISIPITADNELNEQEVITLELLDASGGVIGNSQVSITDTTPSTEAGSAEFSLADYPTDEGKTAEITINRTGDASNALAASVKLGGNAVSGTDYDAPAVEQLNLNWAANDKGSRIISIPITADNEINEQELITLELLDANGGLINSSKVSITDTTPSTEAGSAEFSLADYPTDEGKTAEITINRTGDASSALAASVKLGGNAVSGTDYDAPAAEQLNLSWAANDKGSRIISIPITADNELNEQEVITLELLDANGGVIGNSQVSITDTTPSTEAGSAEFSLADYPTDEGKTAEITINRTGDASSALAASVKLAGNAASGTDYDAPAAEQLNLNWLRVIKTQETSAFR
jgi:predicted RNA-binding protein with TRAM domain